MGLRDALATPDLRRLQLAWAAAAVGGWAFMVTLAVHAYGVGGAAAVGLAALVRMLPAGLAAPLMGLAADRFPRRDVLLASTFARAKLLAAAAVTVALDGPFALLLVIGVLFTVAQSAHKPAQAALLPHLAPNPHRQAAANAVSSGIDNAAFILGALAGGVLAGTLGVPAAFAAAAATFVAAAALLACLKRDRPPVGNARAGEGSRTHAGSGSQPEPGLSLFMGVRVVAGDPKLRVLAGVLAASTLVEGMVDVLVVVAALDVVNLGDAGVGWLNGAWGVGGLVGGAVALRVVVRGRLDAALPAGLLLVGLPLIALALVPVGLAALACLATLGLGYTLVEVAGITLLQRLARDDVRAQAFAVLESSYWLTTGAGAMLAPLVVALAGPRGALAIVGAALPLVVLATRRLPAKVATAARPAAA